VEGSDPLLPCVGLEVLQHHLADHQARFPRLRFLHGARFAGFRRSTRPDFVFSPFWAREARRTRVQERSTACFFRRDSRGNAIHTKARSSARSNPPCGRERPRTGMGEIGEKGGEKDGTEGEDVRLPRRRRARASAASAGREGKGGGNEAGRVEGGHEAKRRQTVTGWAGHRLDFPREGVPDRRTPRKTGPKNPDIPITVPSLPYAVPPPCHPQFGVSFLFFVRSTVRIPGTAVLEFSPFLSFFLSFPSGEGRDPIPFFFLSCCGS